MYDVVLSATDLQIYILVGKKTHTVITVEVTHVCCDILNLIEACSIMSLFIVHKSMYRVSCKPYCELFCLDNLGLHAEISVFCSLRHTHILS